MDDAVLIAIVHYSSFSLDEPRTNRKKLCGLWPKFGLATCWLQIWRVSTYGKNWFTSW